MAKYLYMNSVVKAKVSGIFDRNMSLGVNPRPFIEMYNYIYPSDGRDQRRVCAFWAYQTSITNNTHT